MQKPTRVLKMEQSWLREMIRPVLPSSNKSKASPGKWLRLSYSVITRSPRAIPLVMYVSIVDSDA